MIPKHLQFIKAIHDRKKVSVRFYSKADNGVVDRICAPMSYGPVGENRDDLNRYWLWDYESLTSFHPLGLLPQQIIDLQVLGEVFDPGQFTSETSPVTVALEAGLSGAQVAASVIGRGPIL